SVAYNVSLRIPSAHPFLYLFLFHISLTTVRYTLSLHDALPISSDLFWMQYLHNFAPFAGPRGGFWGYSAPKGPFYARKTPPHPRSEEHTSELQSRFDLVCRLLPEKEKAPENGVVCLTGYVIDWE